ncbi:MAG: hypothetical protein ACI9UT_003366 [Flavobacteriales bacterium]|jgi:hypothetical protein
MPSSYCFTFCALEMFVRYGDGNTNNNDIISCYVHMGLERAKSFSDIGAVQRAHMRVIDTLIDTMCDHCLESVWRKHCYRYIKRLLPLLYEMLDQQQYKQKTQEIRTLHAYFFEDNQNEYQLHNPQHSNLYSVKEQSSNPKTVLNPKKN